MTDTEYINWERVTFLEKIGELPHGRGKISTYRAHFGPDHSEIVAFMGDPVEFLNSGPVVPALPGYQLAQSTYDDPPEAYLTPIIAWRCGRGWPIPIALDDQVNGGDADWAIVLPNGAVILQGNRNFANVAEWLAYDVAERDEREAREKAKRAASIHIEPVEGLKS
jgi:hypothetical protein